MLATYGRELSFEERFVERFYLALNSQAEAMKEIKKLPPVEIDLLSTPPKSPITYHSFKKLLDETEKREKTLVDIFVWALYMKDASTILRLAHAVQFFGENPNRHPVDNERRKLLFVKMISRDPADYLSLHEIAQLLGKTHSEDGYSALRRKCKKLKVPFRSEKKNKPSKSVKSLK